MRVLYFSPRICWPTVSGAHLRDFYFARELARQAELTYLGLVSEDSPAQAERLRGQLSSSGSVEVVAIRRDASYRRSNILRGLIGPTPLNVLNFTSPRVMVELERLLERQSFEVVQIESMHLIAYARPAYPPEALARRVEGKVTLDIIIGKDGAVQNLSVRDGDPVLAESAMKTVRHWAYRPTLVNGIPVEVQTEVELSFRAPGQAAS